jgi:hypothetical protein
MQRPFCGSSFKGKKCLINIITSKIYKTFEWYDVGPKHVSSSKISVDNI